MASKRSKATKNAFADRLKAEAVLTSPLKGEWTKDTAVIPQNMRNDPLSVFINTLEFLGPHGEWDGARSRAPHGDWD
jgi:hypothetical protein